MWYNRNALQTQFKFDLIYDITTVKQISPSLKHMLPSLHMFCVVTACINFSMCFFHIEYIQGAHGK